MNASVVCPLCEHASKARNHLREYLHDRHHKSEVIVASLSAISR